MGRGDRDRKPFCFRARSCASSSPVAPGVRGVRAHAVLSCAASGPERPHPKRNMPGHATHHAKRRCGSLVRPWGWEGRPLVLEPVKRTPQSRGGPGERGRQLCRTPAAGWVSAPSQPDICHLPACAGSSSTRPGVLGSGLWSVGAQTQTLRFTAMIDHQAAPGQWSSKER